MRTLTAALAVAACSLGSQPALAAVVIHTSEDTFFFESRTGLRAALTYKTTIELRVPRTTLRVGESAPFTIVGEINNTASGAWLLEPEAFTVFGVQENETDDIRGHHDSFIYIEGAKEFVGPHWSVRANDNVPGEVRTYKADLRFVGAEVSYNYLSEDNQDWFELLPRSSQEVDLRNRLILPSVHGGFTGSGASFRIDGMFKDTGVGTSPLGFLSWANYSYHATLASGDFQRLGTDRSTGRSIHLSVPITSTAVPEPGAWMMMLTGFAAIGGAMRSAKRRQKLTLSYA